MCSACPFSPVEELHKSTRQGNFHFLRLYVPNRRDTAGLYLSSFFCEFLSSYTYSLVGVRSLYRVSQLFYNRYLFWSWLDEILC